MARKKKADKKEVEERLVTVSEYALHRNLTTARIYELLRRGRIPKLQINGQVMIPFERAEKCLTATTYPGRDQSDSEDGNAPETYAGNRAKREKFEAELKRLSYEQKAGKLIEREHIEKIAFEVARRTRDNLLTIPDRIAADVAAETDPQKVHFMITEALLGALNHGLSEPLKGESKPLVSPQEGEPEQEPEEDELGADDV